MSLVTRDDPIPLDRLELAVSAHRTLALAYGLLAFVVGFSVDDLQVLRFPGYLLGIAAAVLLIAVGPLLMGRRYARAHARDADADFAARSGRLKRAGALAALVAALAVVGWLVAFSTGVPPWVR